MLSVIIPTYKRTESLEKLLLALLGQQDINMEIIVVDQNPPDFFSGNLEMLLTKVIRVSLDMPNASTARNIGFRQSHAPHILFIDDDLLPEKTFCLDGLHIFSAYKEIKCFSPLVYNAEGKDIAISYAKKKMIDIHSSDSNIFSITDTMSAAIFFERDFYVQTGGFSEALFEFAKTAEDQEFFLRMNLMNMRVWYVSSLEIYHNESVLGGCELRTKDYWVTRQKCIRAWVYRYRIHNFKNPGSVSAKNYFNLSRSVFLNRDVLGSGLHNIVKQIKLLRHALRDSRAFYLNNVSSQKTIFNNNLK